MSKQVLKKIETKLDQLIRHCQQLEKENATLKAREDGWRQERSRLIEKNEIARTRVEAIISRLKSIEANP